MTIKHGSSDSNLYATTTSNIVTKDYLAAKNAIMYNVIKKTARGLTDKISDTDDRIQDAVAQVVGTIEDTETRTTFLVNDARDSLTSVRRILKDLQDESRACVLSSVTITRMLAASIVVGSLAFVTALSALIISLVG